MRTTLKLLAIISVVVALASSVFLGFYQCGGYISVRQTVTAVAVASFLLSVATSYRASGNSIKVGGSLTAVFVVLLIMAWYSGQALYMGPNSVSEFFGSGC